MKNIAFTLFGATGDLALKKIFPALAGLYAEGFLGAAPTILAVGRRDWDDAGFLDFLRASSSGLPEAFLARVSYSIIDIEAGTDYEELAARLAELGLADKDAIFYSSLAPALHSKAIVGLRDAGLLASGKILIEKPFGTDRKSACALDKLLASFLDESQIFRVDHYLGKDTVMAIMDLQDKSSGWSSLLSSESVQEIKVRIFEEKGIEGRGASYDGVGAFRDVGQNHLLEMLAVAAAKPSKDWQKARAAVLDLLAPPAKTCDLSRRAQYDGYLNEKGVVPGSQTETAFEVVTSLSSGKLKGVPLVLESGKKMGTSEAFIEVWFKDIPGLPRKMRFDVQPEPSIAIVGRDGSIEAYEVSRARDAYGNVILAAIQGDRRLFVGRAEIEALWGYADHVVACWDKVPLEKYSGISGKGRPFLIE